VLIDEDPIVARIEAILDGWRSARACVEWGKTIYEAQIHRLGVDDQPNYRVSIFDGDNKSIYVRGHSVGATWIECPHPNIERGWWRLSACGVDFLEEVIADAESWVIDE
jgi:hypothetical protein